MAQNKNKNTFYLYTQCHSARNPLQRLIYGLRNLLCIIIDLCLPLHQLFFTDTQAYTHKWGQFTEFASCFFAFNETSWKISMPAYVDLPCCSQDCLAFPAGKEVSSDYSAYFHLVAIVNNASLRAFNSVFSKVQSLTQASRDVQ